MPDKERKHLEDTPRSRRRQKKLIEAIRKRRKMKKAGAKKKLEKRKQSIKETRKMLRRSKKGVPEAADSMLKQLGRKSTKKTSAKGKMSLYERYMMAKKARRLKKKK